MNVAEYCQLVAHVESCRDLGRGAIRSGEDPLDVLDRQLDHVLGRLEGLTTDELGSSPAVSPRKCPSCGCGSPVHTVDCEQADAA